MGQICVLTVLAIWFALSVLNHLPLKARATLRGYDELKLIPNWFFFAPHPFDSDMSIIYRLVDPDGAAQPWKEVEWITPRRLTDALWNPKRRRTKNLTDMMEHMRTLAILAIDDPRCVLTQSSAYLAMLEIVTHQCPGESEEGTYVQFAILRSCMFDPTAQPTILMRSGLHALPRL